MFIKPNFLLLEYLNRSPQEKKKKRISRKEMDRFEARGYQLEMLEQSLQENIIFVVRENLVMITDECMQHLTAKDRTPEVEKLTCMLGFDSNLEYYETY